MALSKPSLKIRSCQISFQDYAYRSPMKFGGKVVDRATVLQVQLEAEGSGRTALGTAAMPLGNAWSWPSKALGFDGTMDLMKDLAEKCRQVVAHYGDQSHPLQIGMELQAEFGHASLALAREKNLSESIPKLCTVVTASAFDLALHDAYGRLCGRNVYDCYGPDYCHQDLGTWLGPDFKGEYLDRYVSKDPVEAVPLYHTVGALDALTDGDISRPAGDGLPDCLTQWIARDGVRYFKIKLNGSDLAWDIQRLASVDRVARENLQKLGVSESTYSLDFNETCPHVAYLKEFISHFQQNDPETLRRVQLFEQPSARSAKATPENSLKEAAAVKPLVADEALADFESFRQCQALGYNGAALKTCKGQTLALLMGAMAQKYGMFLCVMDLTCPGQAYLGSASLASRVPGVAAIEANARQYLPLAAHEPWNQKYPETFQIKDGKIRTAGLTGEGLGFN
jgi:L-alanine-DL-glutamate epimerase-like enolase superfamily enzyme